MRYQHSKNAMREFNHNFGVVKQLLKLNVHCMYHEMKNPKAVITTDQQYLYTSIHLNIRSLPAKYDQLRTMISELNVIRSGAVFRSEGSPSNPKDLCHFQLEVKDVCWKHRRSFGFKGQPHKSFRSKGLARVPSMKSI